MLLPEPSGEPTANPGDNADRRENGPCADSPSNQDASVPACDEAASSKLSKEEQMERYEEYLKENDWGHQPC
jgi:hypothetical protein